MKKELKAKKRRFAGGEQSPPTFDIRVGQGASRVVFPIFSDLPDEEWHVHAGGVPRSFSPFFKGRAGEILSTDTTILLGLGERDRFHGDVLFSAFRSLGAQLQQSRPDSVELHLSPAFLAELQIYGQLHSDGLADPYAPRNKAAASKKGRPSRRPQPDYLAPFTEEDAVFQMVYGLMLGGFSTAVLKTEKEKNGTVEPRRTVRVAVHAASIVSNRLKAWVSRAVEVATLANAFRHIAALPGNYMNPDQYEVYARGVAERHQLKWKCIKGAELERQGFGGVIAVGKGSVIPPRVLVLEYRGNGKGAQHPLVLVGKGITFDSGGISLKPPADMHEMKFDMSGSGLVLHAIAMAAALKLNAPVVAIIGLAENMPDGNATKPGDVYTAYNGLTVEVQNTDAEGRLVLADLLAYAAESYRPRALLDFATLTGACVIALGHEATAFLTASEALAADIDRACRRSLDRGWRMPHWSVYDEGLKSDIADLRNVAGRAAGTITGMRFLSRFVPAGIAWAHFDIAGTAYRTTGADHVRGPSGWGMRFLAEFLRSLDEK